MAAKTMNKEFLERVDHWSRSDRLKSLKQRYFDSPRKICSERAQLAMESWKETEGEDIEVRRAKLVKKILEGIPLAIHEDQIVAGSETAVFIGANPWFDLSGNYIRQVASGEKLGTNNPVTKGVVSDEDRKILLECARFWEGKTGGDAARRVRNNLMKEWFADVVEARGAGLLDILFPGSFLGIPMFDKVLGSGLRAIIAEAEANIERFKEQQETDVDKLYFWQSVVIVCEAVCVYAKRYAQLAREMAQREKSAGRKKQLEEMARACDRVPENPARTFYEAVQSVILIMMAIRLEQTAIGNNWGRIDQYLYPYFEKDYREGRITPEEGLELAGEILLWNERLCQAGDDFSQQFIHNSSVNNNLNVGGVDAQGNDACNELTYIFMHVEGEVKCTSPWFTFRWNPATPHYMMLKALECNRKTKGGQPMFMGDIHLIDYLTKTGIPLEEAREYGIAGCIQVLPPGRHVSMIGNVQANAALWFDVMLHNGVAPVNGKRIGLETGDPRSFRTFDEFYEAYKKQLQFGITRPIVESFVEMGAIAKAYRHPLLSSLISGCVEKGYDACCLEKYPDQMIYIIDRGIVDAADSLTVIKKLVYDEKRLTMSELIEALDSNFEEKRGEEIRRMCLAVPKYGNMIDEADTMVRELGTFSSSVVSSLSAAAPAGAVCRSYRPGGAWHYWAGPGVAALPNGRKAFEPLYDGCISPGRGMDKRGPTAVLQSALKAGFKETVASILNQKFSGTAMQSPESLEKLSILTETFLREGGSHIQYNIIDKETLLDAQKRPEEHRDLVIRVAGYSAYFVELSAQIQNDIIARNEQEVG